MPFRRKSPQQTPPDPSPEKCADCYRNWLRLLFFMLFTGALFGEQQQKRNHVEEGNFLGKPQAVNVTVIFTFFFSLETV